MLLGSFQPAREDVQSLRPYRGAQEAARRLREYSRGSSLVESHKDCGRVQDAYSLRCVPQVMGASWDAILHVEQQLEVELNAVNDNPLVFAESGETVSAGLFHAQPVALAADYLKIAVAEIASLSDTTVVMTSGSSVSSIYSRQPCSARLTPRSWWTGRWARTSGCAGPIFSPCRTI